MKPHNQYAFWLCIALAIIILTCRPVRAEAWNSENVAGETAVVTLLAADWLQTRQIAKHPETYEETNVFLGKHPTVARVNAHFAFFIFESLYMSPRWTKSQRRIMQTVTIYTEYKAVKNNLNFGINVRF